MSERAVHCRICGSICDSKPVMIREMMFGMRRRFPYRECTRCGCLQIENYPADIDVYYPADYYSFQKLSTDPFRLDGIISRLKTRLLLYNHLIGGDLLGRLGKKTLMPFTKSFEQIRQAGIKPWSRILDVGAGNGRFLCQLYRMGFKDLTGVDKFMPEDTTYFNSIRVWKKEIGQLDRRYDLITLHHVLEHMPSQADVLKSLKERLHSSGIAMIRIPVKNRAWEIYGENWVQLDAPRHFYLHTHDSFSILAEEAGFRVKKIQFDSTAFQFWGSEQYRQNISLRRDERSWVMNGNVNKRHPKPLFTADQIEEWEKQAERYNNEGSGDQAVFYLESME